MSIEERNVLVNDIRKRLQLRYEFPPAKDGDTIPFKFLYTGEPRIQGVKTTCGCFKTAKANPETGIIEGTCTVNAKADRKLYKINGRHYQEFVRGAAKFYADILQPNKQLTIPAGTEIEEVKAGYFSKNIHVYFDDGEDILEADADHQIKDNTRKVKTSVQISGYVLP